ncbi:MAG: hypothetical protein EZS28_010123 [Streblomastix strix]|uniref:Uncharacterized protein n=1 Tax=Streblomastix strix TaxID=222440 RepID=A0A5J4WHG8_9EUKA|nr:MAG: hypothetical protein EZS28_010123 [Streblomastix strix]
MQKDPDANENQTQRRSEMKTPIQLIQSESNTQKNHSKDINFISPQHNTPHKSLYPHAQQHSSSLTMKETLAILGTISPGDPRGHKEKEPEQKQPKLQQHAGQMNVVERYHEIMKQIIEEEKKKPKIMFPGLYKEYPNKDGPSFFHPPQNYRPTPIPRPKDLDLSEEQWNKFDGDGKFPKRIIDPTVIGLIIFTVEQIIESETESKNQEQLTTELERIVTDGTYDNGEEDQYDHVIEPKHLTNGNDGLRKNDSGTQLQASVNGEANPEIDITKISANTPLHTVNGSNGLGGNGCGTQLQAITNENGHLIHQAIDYTGNENNNEQTNDNRTRRKQNNQKSNNENKHEQETKRQDNRNTKLRGTVSFLTTHPEQELRNKIILQSKGQSPLITTSRIKLSKGKVVITKQRMQPTKDHDTRSKTGLPKSVRNKSLWNPEARANSDTPNHFTPLQERKKKADLSPVIEVKSVKRSKGNKTSARSKKSKQGSNSENQIEIRTYSETLQPEQLD